MLKVITLLAVLTCLLHGQPTIWNSWNAFAAANYTYVHNISHPAVPTGFNRYVDTSANQSTYFQRPNQYRYYSTFSLLGAVCSIYCGPRSFLTTDTNGSYICQRDQDKNFWGATSYAKYCIPDFDASYTCRAISLTQGSIANCNMIAYKNIPAYANY
jgi:hypothetical protein